MCSQHHVQWPPHFICEWIFSMQISDDISPEESKDTSLNTILKTIKKNMRANYGTRSLSVKPAYFQYQFLFSSPKGEWTTRETGDSRGFADVGVGLWPVFSQPPPCTFARQRPPQTILRNSCQTDIPRIPEPSSGNSSGARRTSESWPWPLLYLQLRTNHLTFLNVRCLHVRNEDNL